MERVISFQFSLKLLVAYQLPVFYQPGNDLQFTEKSAGREEEEGGGAETKKG